MHFRALLIAVTCLGSLNAQNITTIVGNGTAGYNGDDIPATTAELNLPVYVATDAAGNIYIADQTNNRIRKVDLTGNITTVAGNGNPGFSGDGGPATAAGLYHPTGVFVTAAGTIYIADVGNERIRAVTDGTITTIAGTGLQGSSGDGGPATSAEFYNPVRAVVDSAGNIYIADQSNHRVRKIGTDGIIRAFAGTGKRGFSGDGGPALNASFDNPTAVALDQAGNVYIADQFNHRIRRVDTGGIITTVAGNGVATFSGDGGPAIAASLDFPGSLIVDTAGEIFFCDDISYRVRKVSPDGTVSTIAGNGIMGYSGDNGPATAAMLNGQFGIAIDPGGNVLIADSQNQRIRKIANASPVAPAFTTASLTNAASFVGGGSPGALATLFGQHLSFNLNGIASAAATPLPTMLGGTTVTINGILTPLLGVINLNGSEQINLQLPWELAGQTTAQIVVNNGFFSNASVAVPIGNVQPGIFAIDTVPNGAIQHANGTLVSSSKPAAKGEVVVVFATGLGALSPAQITGQPASSTVLASTNGAPTVTVGGLSATVLFSGEAPGFVSLNQLNIQVPEGVGSGEQDLIVSLSGVASNTVKIQIQ